MSDGLPIYSIIYLISAAVAAVAAIFAWRRRSAPGGTWLLSTLACAIIWSAADAMEASAPTIPWHVFWSQVSYLGAQPIGVFLLLFALEYSGRPWVRPSVVAALLAVPSLAVLAAFTNSWHHLIWTGFSRRPDAHNLIVYYHGWLYWAFAAYAYTAVLLAVVALVGFALANRDVYRYQSLTVLLAVGIPLSAEIFYDLAPHALPGVDPSVTLSLAAAILTVGMLQFKLLDLAPVARKALVERLDDPVLVLDAELRLVEANPKARKLFGIVERGWIGEPASKALIEWPQIVELIAAAQQDTESQVISPNGRHFTLIDNVVRDRAGRCTGRVAVLRDVTEFVNTEDALQDANARLRDRLSEIEALHEELREQAVRDPLTGLYNRRYLSETIERELARAKRESYPVSLIMLDIDHFKRINDTHGHAAGDQVLRFIGAELRSLVRAGDIACRYGGDEFVLVLLNVSLGAATKRADECRTSVGESSVYWTQWAEPMTISLGVAEFPTHGKSAEEVMAAADAAVYEAKAAGRNRTVVADAGLDSQ